MENNDYFSPQSKFKTATFKNFQRLLAAKWNQTDFVQNLGTSITNSNSDIVISALESMIPWLLAFLAVIVMRSLMRLVSYRRSYKIACTDLKSPPHSMLLGTTPELIELYKTSPRDAHPMTTLTLLYRKYRLGDLYFIDLWPAADRMTMIINSPEIAIQVQESPKFDLYNHFVGHLTGKRSMVFTEGDDWKRMRGLFNPGFAISHLMTLVPMIVDVVAIFTNKLGELADAGEVYPIEELLARLTIDITGRIILEHDLNSQTAENEMVTAFRKQVYWTPAKWSRGWIGKLDILTRIMQRHYTMIMDNYLRKVIRARVASKSNSEGMICGKQSSRRPAIDLAIDEYMLASKGGTIDQEFEQLAIDQMKTFLFAGHDTTSTTISYIYYILGKHPEAMEKIRQEHMRVFRSSTGAGDEIKARPQALNELPYTTAVIKETLRLFPPASTLRNGSPDLAIQHNSVSYPTAGAMIWINNHTMHRRADYFPQPDDFIPERFLPGEDMWDGQGDVKNGTFRPFEKGPRACIGQELAMLEIKLILAMTVGGFDLKTEYAEWETKLKVKEPGSELGGRRMMFGHRPYLQMKASGKPAEGMPARVTRREEHGPKDERQPQ